MSKIELINNMTIGINNEDNTIVNPLKHLISSYNNKDIDFCGYTIPHPSENKVHLVVQFKDESKQNPEDLISKIEEGIESFKKVINKISYEFNK